MVLKKPYAFLIKHFRLIHIIIGAIFLFVAITSMNIYRYLNTVVKNTLNRYDATSYLQYGIFFFIFLGLVLCVIVFLLLKYKNKPRRIYIVTFIGYAIIIGYMFTLFNYMHGFSENIIEQKTIRLYRDILLILQLFEYYITIFMFIRGTGFDIKKFNFNLDLQELNATLEDSQEVEIDTRIDTTNVVRVARKQGRELGYYYKEYKIYIIVILSAVGLFLLYKGYSYFDARLKLYGEGDLIGEAYQITIKDSYYYTEDTDKYVIVNFDIKKPGSPKMFNGGLMTLTIGRRKYTPDNNICYRFTSLGTCYKRQFINKNTDNYILVYKVDRLNASKTRIEYNESYEREYKVKLALKEFIKND